MVVTLLVRYSQCEISSFPVGIKPPPLVHPHVLCPALHLVLILVVLNPWHVPPIVALSSRCFRFYPFCVILQFPNLLLWVVFLLHPHGFLFNLGCVDFIHIHYGCHFFYAHLSRPSSGSCFSTGHARRSNSRWRHVDEIQTADF
jgi:hypothetical protein